MTPINRIRLAQDFFRFAYLIGSPISFGLPVQFPEPPAVRVWGEHSFSPEEAKLDPDAFGLCGAILERLAYRLLAMELDSALAAVHGKDRFNHADAFIRDASIVVNLIRVAVAHNALDPIWLIDRKMRKRIHRYWRNGRTTIDGVLTFDTTDLNGEQLKRLDFGGPLALFRLSERIAAIWVLPGRVL